MGYGHQLTQVNKQGYLYKEAPEVDEPRLTANNSATGKTIKVVIATVITLISVLSGLAISPYSANAMIKISSATGGAYVPLSPVRICDTRAGTGTPCSGHTMGPEGIMTVSMPNSVPSNAIAVVLNVTVTGPTNSGYLTAFPAPVTPVTSATSPGVPNASNLNFSAGETVPNLVTVQLGTSNSVDFANGSIGSTDVVVDLQGYYLAPALTTGDSGHYFPLSPRRIVDTRSGAPNAYAGETLGSGGELPVHVAGHGGVPSSGVSAVVMNVTVTNTSNAGFLTVWPAGGTQPVVSNLNWVAGQTVANRVIVPVNAAGDIDVASAHSSADVIIDVNGYFSDATGSWSAGSLFVPLSPGRIIDTRNSAPIAGNSSLSVLIAGQQGVPSATSANPADAVLLNVTEADTTASAGYITVYPSNASAPPNASDVNFAGSTPVPNMDIATLIGTSTNIYNFQGNTDVIVDVNGYFTPASPGADNVSVVGPNSVPADGKTTSNLTISVTNGVGVAQASVGLSISETPSVAGACGTLGTTSGTTNAQGLLPFTYQSSATAGSCDISAVITSTGAGYGQMDVTQTAVPDDLSFTSTPYQVGANGSNTVNLQVSLTNNGAATSGSVTLALSPNPAGSCGTVTSSTINVVAGVGTDQYRSSSTPGICVITATGPGGVISTTDLVQSVSTYTSHYGVTLSLVPSSIAADGKSATAAKLTVKDGNGVPVSGDSVAFTTNGCATPSNSVATTDSTGVAEIALNSSRMADPTCTISAVEGDTGASTTTDLTETQVVNVTVIPSSSAVVSGGTAPIGLTVRVTTPMGPVSGDTVTLSSPCTGLQATSLFTNNSGLAYSAFMAPSSSQICIITGTESDFGGSGLTPIAVTSATSLNIVSVANLSVTGLTGTKGSINVTVTNGGVPVANDTLYATLVSGVAGGCGSLSGNSATTNSSGVGSFTYNGSNMPSTCSVSVLESNSGKFGFGTVTQVFPPSALTISINGSSTSLPIATMGSSQTNVPVVITARDGYGNPLPGVYVTLNSLGLTPSGKSSVCGTFASNMGTTDAQGQFVTTYNPNGQGYCAVLAGSSQVPGLFFVLAIQAANPTASPDKDIVVASPSVIPADGQSTTILHARVFNSSGLPVVGDTVIFLNPKLLPVSLGGSTTCGGLPASAQTDGLGLGVYSTDANGEVSVPFVASSTPGVCAVLFSDSNTLGGSPAIVLQVPVGTPAPTIGLSATLPNSPVAGGSAVPINVSVTGNSSPLSGDPLSVSVAPMGGETGTCGTVAFATLPYSISGASQILYTPSSTVGFCTVTISESEGGLSYVMNVPQLEVAPSSSYTLIPSLTGLNLTVTVTNSNGINVANDPVAVTPSTGCQGKFTIANLEGNTNSSGVFSTTVSTSPPPSGCTIAVQEADTGGQNAVP